MCMDVCECVNECVGVDMWVWMGVKVCVCVDECVGMEIWACWCVEVWVSGC